MVPGTDIGDVGPEGERFLDNQHIEGTLPQMLSAALTFVNTEQNVEQGPPEMEYPQKPKSHKQRYRAVR